MFTLRFDKSKIKYWISRYERINEDLIQPIGSRMKAKRFLTKTDFVAWAWASPLAKPSFLRRENMLKKYVFVVVSLLPVLAMVVGCAAPVPAASPPAPAASPQVSDKDGMTLLDVPAGEFKMGAASSDTQASSDEKPQHTVYL